MSLLKHVFFKEFYGNETNYEPFEISPQRTDVRKEWRVPDSEKYLIQTIHIMMSSTSDRVLYRGAMLMSNDELKMILGMLVLKEKIKYRIKMSSKTRFEALCKDIGCKF